MTTLDQLTIAYWQPALVVAWYVVLASLAILRREEWT